MVPDIPLVERIVAAKKNFIAQARQEAAEKFEPVAKVPTILRLSPDGVKAYKQWGAAVEEDASVPALDKDGKPVVKDGKPIMRPMRKSESNLHVRFSGLEIIEDDALSGESFAIE